MTVSLMRTKTVKHHALCRPVLAFDVHPTRRPHDLPRVMLVARSGNQRAHVQSVRSIGVEDSRQFARHGPYRVYQPAARNDRV